MAMKYSIFYGFSRNYRTLYFVKNTSIYPSISKKFKLCIYGLLKCYKKPVLKIVWLVTVSIEKNISSPSSTKWPVFASVFERIKINLFKADCTIYKKKFSLRMFWFVDLTAIFYFNWFRCRYITSMMFENMFSF